MEDKHQRLNVGVVGVGHMGRHHVRIVSQSPSVMLAGLYDTDPDTAFRFCSQYGCEAFQTLDMLLDRCDAVIVAAPTSLHRAIGEQCLDRRKHVMMEKPLADSIENGTALVELADRAGVKLMVGHVERYNPAIKTMLEMLKDRDEEIISIDARRLAPFDGSRCLDVDVLYDLLIHDIDLALEIASSDIVRVSAMGRPVFSRETDVAHARIEFSNGACAVFWVGKCSLRKVRTVTVTTRSRYLCADTLENTLTVHTAEELPALESGVCFMGAVRSEEVAVPRDEPLRVELDDFFGAIREDRAPVVDGRRALAGMRALDLVARSISERREIFQ
jgi:predicted dehydrogenase